MRVMIDTNVVLDVLLKRTSFFEPSYEVLKLSTTGQIDGYISASAVTDVYYVLCRTNKDKTVSLHAIRSLLQLVKVADVKCTDIAAALDLGFGDYEDAVQAAVARQNKMDWIITRNENDYTLSPVPAVSPLMFINQFYKS